MSSLDVETLETTFDLVAPRGEELVDLLYERLFALAPEVEPLFAGGDVRRHRAMVLGIFVMLRKSFRDLEAILPKLRALGERHIAYGAQPEHYAVVGRALLDSLAQVAGDAWRPEHAAAWAAAFDVVAGAMIDGARDAELAQAA